MLQCLILVLVVDSLCNLTCQYAVFSGCLAPLVEEVYSESDGSEKACTDGPCIDGHDVRFGLGLLSSQLFLLQVVDGGQLVELLALVALVEAVANDVTPVHVADGFGQTAAHLSGGTAKAETDKKVVTDGVFVGHAGIKAGHRLVEALELPKVVVGGGHHAVAVDGLTPLGLEHLGLGLTGLHEQFGTCNRF